MEALQHRLPTNLLESPSGLVTRERERSPFRQVVARTDAAGRIVRTSPPLLDNPSPTSEHKSASPPAEILDTYALSSRPGHPRSAQIVVGDASALEEAVAVMQRTSVLSLPHQLPLTTAHLPAMQKRERQRKFEARRLRSLDAERRSRRSDRTVDPDFEAARGGGRY